MRLATAHQEPASGLRPDIEALFRKHHALVLQTAFRITGNLMDAEDVLQNLFLRLALRGDAPDLGEGARAYLHRAAVNLSLDVLRNRRPSVPLEEAPCGRLPAAGPDPFQCHSQGELRSWLRKALAGLNPRAAEMWTLRYLEGYGVETVAKMVKASRGTVAVTLFRTRRRLRKELRRFLGGSHEDE
jgi:RNA polymerase sigma-70 factor, ECF subfamily